jgi:Zn finger protein HypA/HybF involved in hydrogenase expression
MDEFSVKKFYAYQCWRNLPFECRHGWELPEELTANRAECPVCHSFQITVKTVEKKVLKQNLKPSKPQKEASKV